MKKLDYSCIIDTSPEEVYAFHIDTRNLPLITPPWINVHIVSMDVPMRLNSRVELQIKRFAIATEWIMKISHLDRPYIVTDEMIRGPFKSFTHERRFVAISDTQTRMDETISLKIGFGFLGDLIFPLLSKDMDKMFAYRHAATQNHFMEKNRVLSL